MKTWILLFLKDPLKALQNAPLSFWLVMAAVGGVALCLIDLSEPAEAKVEKSNSVSSLDTFIPQGFVLIPIDLENYESLDSILGSFGVVDLYFAGESQNSKTQPIARRIKIIRAPQNPSQFAVLVPEAKAKMFFRSQSLFFAAIQNPKQVGSEFEKRGRVVSSRKVLNLDQEEL